MGLTALGRLWEARNSRRVRNSDLMKEKKIKKHSILYGMMSIRWKFCVENLYFKFSKREEELTGLEVARVVTGICGLTIGAQVVTIVLLTAICC